MGLRILYDAREDMAALYDSTSDVAFGPVFYRGEDYTPAVDRAQNFIDWLPLDARQYDMPVLMAKYSEWVQAGEPAGENADV